MEPERARALFQHHLAVLDPEAEDFEAIKRDLRRLIKLQPGAWVGFAAMPADRRDAYWTARLAPTLKGESYGDAEIRTLIKHLPDLYIGHLCAEAIFHLRPVGYQEELIAVMNDQHFRHDLSIVLAMGGAEIWQLAARLYQATPWAGERALVSSPLPSRSPS